MRTRGARGWSLRNRLHLAAHDVARALAHLVVDAAQILAEDPERDELRAHEYEQDREQREHALGRPVAAEREAQDHDQDAERRAERGHPEPERRERAQR